ncbi:MAG: glycosyltransferase family 4 protein [Caldilineaceae bacterium]|nr:glycosyltransferase family 4 protein [Caldilineaceae bacterium]
MTPRPILYVDHANNLGGAEQSLLLLMTFLDHSRWQPHLIAPPGKLAEEAARADIPVRTLDLPRLRGSSRSLLDWWQVSSSISKTARNLNAALIHSNTVRATAYAALAARLSSRPLVWHMRDFWLSEAEPAPKWPDRLGKFILSRMAALVLTNSHAVARHLPNSAKHSVLHNGIDLSRFDPARVAAGNRASICSAAGFPPDAPIVGMVGRARPWKGQHTFLQMAGELAASAPDCRFLVVGGDPFQVNDNYEASLKALCTQLGLDDRVHWTGQLADVRPALAAMDIFVHPGAPEPFGLVNTEAMAMSKPVVSFSHGALPEIVTHNETGLLVAPSDTTALAASVLRLLRDRVLCQSMGRAGRQRVDSRFRIEHTVAQLEIHYQDLVGRG